MSDISVYPPPPAVSAVPPDGDYGDISVTGGIISIDAATVTLAKMADMNTDKLLGRDTAGTGAPEEIGLATSLEFSGSGSIQRSALTGDVTAAAASNATAIGANKVLDTMLRDSAARSVIGNGTNATADPGDIVAGTDGHVLRRSGTTLAFGQIVAAGITDATLTLAKLAQIADGNVVANISGVLASPTAVTVSDLMTALLASIGAPGPNSIRPIVGATSQGDMLYYDAGAGEWKFVDASGASDGDILTFSSGTPTWAPP